MKGFVAVGALLAVLALADAQLPQGWMLTLRPQSMVQTLECLSRNSNQMTCNLHEQCVQRLPHVISERIQECRSMAVPHRTTKCFYNEPATQRPGVIDQIYDCAVSHPPKLSPEQKRMVVDFEDCVRKESCFRQKAHGSYGYEDYDDVHGYDSYRQEVHMMQPRGMQQRAKQHRGAYYHN